VLSAGKRRLNPPALVVAGGLPGLTAADHEFVRVGGWFAAHAGFGGDAFRCCWSLPILSFDLGVLICSRLIRDGQFSRIVEFSPQQRHCVRGQASPPKLGTNFFVKSGEKIAFLGDSITAGGWGGPAVYGFSLSAGQPIADVATKYGAGHFEGNAIYIFSNSGAFVSTLAFCLWLHFREKTFAEFFRPRATSRPAFGNYLLAILTGCLWYGQFFFYGLGHVRMGAFKFSSWGIHMIMLVLFSALVGILFREWKSCRPRTVKALVASLAPSFSPSSPLPTAPTSASPQALRHLRRLWNEPF